MTTKARRPAPTARTRHGVGEPAPGPGPALGTLPDLGAHAAAGDLEHDVVQDAPFPLDGVDAAGVAGLDGGRLLDGGLPEVVARLQVRLRALATVALARVPSGLVLLGPRRREAGVPARPAGRPLRQDGDQFARQAEQDADHGIDLARHLAVLSQRGDAGLRVVELLAQGRAVHARHHSASTAMTAASTASRSSDGIER